jgi:hypothetical protein
MMAYGRMEVEFHAFFRSTVDGVKSSTSQFGRSRLRWKGPYYPFNRRTDGPEYLPCRKICPWMNDFTKVWNKTSSSAGTHHWTHGQGQNQWLPHGLRDIKLCWMVKVCLRFCSCSCKPNLSKHCRITNTSKLLYSTLNSFTFFRDYISYNNGVGPDGSPVRTGSTSKLLNVCTSPTKLQFVPMSSFDLLNNYVRGSRFCKIRSVS